MPELLCYCGSKIPVRASGAGTAVQCTVCSRQLVVPPLWVLNEYSQRGEPVPPAPHSGKVPRPGHGGQIPESFAAHYCGKVGTNQHISFSAMQSYVGSIARVFSAVLQDASPAAQFELMLSCALLPQGKLIVFIETAPKGVENELVNKLETAIRQVPSPQIETGPVGFVMYRRVNLENVTEVGIQPFSCYRESIEHYGPDVALAMAAGIDPSAEERPACAPTLWQRLRQYFTPKNRIPASNPPPVSRHEQMKGWLEHVEVQTTTMSMEELKSLAAQAGHEATGRVALAARHAQTGELEVALQEYTAAVSMIPECAPLLDRRARLHMALSNDQAALHDWNQAIELAPDEPWYRFHRAGLYARLGAWSDAEAELDRARRHAPREPAFALARAEVRRAMERHTDALADLIQVVQLDPNCGPAHLLLSRVLQEEECQDQNRAIDHLTRAVELMPDEIEARVHRSLLYAAQNKLESALADCDAIIQMRPDEGVGYGVRGRVLQLQGGFEEAISACSKAIDLGLESPLVLVARGIAYAATGQPERALSDCDTCLSLDPNNAMALQLRGMLSMQLGELDAAMEALQKAVTVAPKWSEPREYLALLHRITDNPQAAIDEQSTLVAQSPNNPAHHVNRAVAYTHVGDFHHAQRDYDRACELDPENEHIVFLRGCFFMACQEAERALCDFDRVLALADGHDDARLRRAILLIQLNRYREALADFGQLIARHPDDLHGYAGRAYAHQLMGNGDAAEADVAHLRKLAPEKSEEFTIQSLYACVHRLEREERYDEALATAEEIIAIAPEDLTGYRLRAWIHWYTEQHVEARDDYTHLLELDPDQVDLLNSRGQVQAEMGEFQAALHDLDAAVAKSREAGQKQLLAFALNGRALALAGLSRMDESTSDYEESIRLCPSNAWAYYNRGIVMHRRGDAVAAQKLFELALAAKSPPLTKRKRERAQALVRKISERT